MDSIIKHLTRRKYVVEIIAKNRIKATRGQLEMIILYRAFYNFDVTRQEFFIDNGYRYTLYNYISRQHINEFHIEEDKIISAIDKAED